MSETTPEKTAVAVTTAELQQRCQEYERLKTELAIINKKATLLRKQIREIEPSVTGYLRHLDKTNPNPENEPTSVEFKSGNSVALASTKRRAPLNKQNLTDAIGEFFDGSNNKSINTQNLGEFLEFLEQYLQENGSAKQQLRYKKVPRKKRKLDTQQNDENTDNQTVVHNDDNDSSASALF